jgi:Zn-dependent peptidase ImmA (M78 family)
LREHWDGKLPVDPGVIAKRLGLRLEAVGSPFDPVAFSGYFKRSPNDGLGPLIQYNREDSLVRRRFTVAHEIGHFVLDHSDAPRDDPDMFRASVSSPIERAANQFAAELLMPAQAVKRLALSGRYSTVKELADVFSVSATAMNYRLSNLGLSVW